MRDIRKTLDDDALSVLCTELAEILGSGITVAEGFLLISEQEREGRLRSVYEGISAATLAGGTLAGAMRDSGVFPEYALRLIAVAEDTGALEKVAGELADYYDRQARLKRSVKSAVGYPLLLLVIVLTVFFVFLTEVLPVFARVFEQIGASMSPLAGAFLSAGLWLSGARWYFAAVAGALALAGLLCALVPPLRERSAGLFRRMLSGTAAGRSVLTARLASVIALTVSGAADINQALDMSAQFAAGFDREGRTARCRDLVASGRSFADAAGESELFGPAYCRMLAIAQRTGSMDAMTADIARRAQERADRALDSLTAAVEPATVIVLSVLVGLLLMSVMLPLIGIMTAL